MVEKILVL